ncbi:GNAT family N-acetyltransferase [Agromyces salentinus]|uniref:GNAT family N-acetyltransferase n=1 Tax=Agromyces salentinus TaxID=269421 RepID=A0ABP4Z0U1_9MICO|nr:GNAT family N-acetyltransferase [Agromyces salentinus]
MTADVSVRFVNVDDELAAPLLADLEREYDGRYGDFFGEPASTELLRYPASDFEAPHGAFLVLLADGEPVAGGAFRRYDEHTAELKRVWTHPGHRGQGLGRRVVAELERAAHERGYRDVTLTTGPRQPEAVALYLASGYVPRFDPSRPAEEIGIHGFDKHLDTAGVLA